MNLLFIVLLFSSLTATAQIEVYVYGYMVNTGNDTLLCNIKISGKKKVSDYTSLVIKTPEG